MSAIDDFVMDRKWHNNVLRRSQPVSMRIQPPNKLKQRRIRKRVVGGSEIEEKNLLVNKFTVVIGEFIAGY